MATAAINLGLVKPSPFSVPKSQTPSKLWVFSLRSPPPLMPSQNHNYAVDPKSLPDGVEVTHVNLNDGTCAGLAYPARNIMSVQYHPEASPRPHDSDYAFGEFIELMNRVKVNA